MIVAMQHKATEEQIRLVIERMVELGFNVHRTTGAVQTILAGVGTPVHFELADFEVMAGVEDAHRISSPYKLAGRDFRPEGTIINFANGVIVGGKEVVVMGGPCSVESREQILKSAEQVRQPARSSFAAEPSSRAARRTAFQGMGLEGLKLLREAGDEHGLLVITRGHGDLADRSHAALHRRASRWARATCRTSTCCGSSARCASRCC